MKAGAPQTEYSTGASSQITPHTLAIMQEEWNTGTTPAIEAKKVRISELETWFGSKGHRPQLINKVGTQEKNELVRFKEEITKLQEQEKNS